MRTWLMVSLLAAHALACAHSDVGLVNQVSGEVAYTPGSGAPNKAKAFMKVRAGDRFDVPAGAQLRVVFFESARQERWQGPASFRAAAARGNAISGAPAEVTMLPASVSRRIARVPELMQNARLGGIQVRGIKPVRAVDEDAVKEARAAYAKLRKESAADDITPELFLYSALSEYQLYEEMAPVVEDMRRRQPASDDVKSLETWLKGRRNR